MQRMISAYRTLLIVLATVHLFVPTGAQATQFPPVFTRKKVAINTNTKLIQVDLYIEADPFTVPFLYTVNGTNLMPYMFNTNSNPCAAASNELCCMHDVASNWSVAPSVKNMFLTNGALCSCNNSIARSLPSVDRCVDTLGSGEAGGSFQNQLLQPLCGSVFDAQQDFVYSLPPEAAFEDITGDPSGANTRFSFPLSWVRDNSMETSVVSDAYTKYSFFIGCVFVRLFDMLPFVSITTVQTNIHVLVENYLVTSADVDLPQCEDRSCEAMEFLNCLSVNQDSICERCPQGTFTFAPSVSKECEQCPHGPSIAYDQPAGSLLESCSFCSLRDLESFLEKHNQDDVFQNLISTTNLHTTITSLTCGSHDGHYFPEVQRCICCPENVVALPENNILEASTYGRACEVDNPTIQRVEYPKKYFNDVGQEEYEPQCIGCPMGLYFDSLSSTCKLCGPGTFTNTTGATACLACPPGTFQDEAGKWFCKSCHLGYATSQDRTECISCGPGFFQSVYFAEECSRCEGDQYSVNDTNIGCRNCPLNSVGLQDANDLKDTCVCVPGHESVDEQGSVLRGVSLDCQPCKSGTFSATNAFTCSDCGDNTISPGEKSTYCESCPADSYANSDHTTCTCENGYEGEHWDTDSYSLLLQCHPCAAGTYSTGGVDCTSCGEGSYVASTAATQCDSCVTSSSNRIVAQNKTACICDARHEPPSDRPDGDCLPCADGFWKQQVGDHACIAIVCNDDEGFDRDAYECRQVFGTTCALPYSLDRTLWDTSRVLELPFAFNVTSESLASIDEVGMADALRKALAGVMGVPLFVIKILLCAESTHTDGYPSPGATRYAIQVLFDCVGDIQYDLVRSRIEELVESPTNTTLTITTELQSVIYARLLSANRVQFNQSSMLTTVEVIENLEEQLAMEDALLNDYRSQCPLLVFS